jgi:thiamine-phosphate pyrophosphorylase
MAKRLLSDSFGFYSVLTDPLTGYAYLTSLLVDYGVPAVQLRMKGALREIVVDTALQMRKITEGTDTLLIINDDPHIAAEVGADGVHIGQGDMSYTDARAIVGDDMLIGVSTHNLRQTINACQLPADYIGIGPVFATPTKKIPDPVIGIDGMREMLSASTVPAVAIGGINLENLPIVLAAGAKNFCMVRQLTQSENPKSVLEKIMKSSYRQPAPPKR